LQNERQPLYIQIQEDLKNLIREGKLKKDDKIPTEKQLTEQYRVSRITVVNALADLAKDGWIYRVPGRGSFVSDNQDLIKETKGEKETFATTHIDTKESNRPMVGLIIPSLGDYFAIRLIRGIQRILNNENYYLAIVTTNNSKELEEEMIRDLIKRGAVGLIIFPVDAETYNEEIIYLKVNRFPFVLIDRNLPGIETNFVCSDSFIGARLAVEHLWEQGHRDIAICSDSPLPTMTISDRISGYMEALKDKNALINPSLILTDFRIDYTKIDQQHPLYHYLKKELASAYITLNNELGLYLKMIAEFIGLRVPEDVSILTFDDPYPIFENYGSFTHVNQWEEKIGEKSAQILIENIRDPESFKNNFQKIILKPELIAKRTTGPIRSVNKQ
jgi:GntR family transcriptional regulator, arabinose operon transcriptional repressor